MTLQCTMSHMPKPFLLFLQNVFLVFNTGKYDTLTLKTSIVYIILSFLLCADMINMYIFVQLSFKGYMV